MGFNIFWGYLVGFIKRISKKNLLNYIFPYNTPMNTQGVFFVVSPIGWQNFFSWETFFWSLFATFVCVCIFFVWQIFQKFIKNRQKKSKPEPRPILPIPDMWSKNWNEKAFLFLQNFVQEKYLPENTPAHTFADIKKYCDNKEILSLYQELENSIFERSSLTSNRKRDISEFLSSLK